MKQIHVGDSVRVGTKSEEVRGTVVDLDRRPGYGRLIIDCAELGLPGVTVELPKNPRSPVVQALARQLKAAKGT